MIVLQVRVIEDKEGVLCHAIAAVVGEATKLEKEVVDKIMVTVQDPGIEALKYTKSTLIEHDQTISNHRASE